MVPQAKGGELLETQFLPWRVDAVAEGAYDVGCRRVQGRAEAQRRPAGVVRQEGPHGIPRRLVALMSVEAAAQQRVLRPRVALALAV